MTTSHIINCRLANQQIAEASFNRPDEIVSWLGAMQSQEFAMAKWAIGLRQPALTDADVERAFNDGLILRTHLLRPTWHFVTPADIRWILKLTAPRINAFSAPTYRKLELDRKLFSRSNNIFAKTLESKSLTRVDLKTALEQNKINADGLRLICLLMHAELEGIICSGPRKGKQFTYALLDERAPSSKKLSHDEAVSKLCKCYFTSRGPATVKDFTWWSGLTVKDAKAGVACLDKNFISERSNGRDYFFLPANLTSEGKGQTTFLMPDYDEYAISYKNRDAIFTSAGGDKAATVTGSLFKHNIVIKGVVAGTWQRTISKKKVVVQSYPHKTLSHAKSNALLKAEKRYLKFVNGN